MWTKVSKWWNAELGMPAACRWWSHGWCSRAAGHRLQTPGSWWPPANQRLFPAITPVHVRRVHVLWHTRCTSIFMWIHMTMPKWTVANDICVSELDFPEYRTPHLTRAIPSSWTLEAAPTAEWPGTAAPRRGCSESPTTVRRERRTDRTRWAPPAPPWPCRSTWRSARARRDSSCRRAPISRSPVNHNALCIVRQLQACKNEEMRQVMKTCTSTRCKSCTQSTCPSVCEKE